ncbi:hypothetical protein C0991_012389 [Blastosporella zonata]|nr:hypothetical protein C0991_012389 [Blastosporella zonata]
MGLASSLAGFSFYKFKDLMGCPHSSFPASGFSTHSVTQVFKNSALQPTTTPLTQNVVVSLDIVIVGAGIGGLAAAYCLGRTGHKVTVLESASFLQEAGAGIQASPNLTRLLIRWGLGEKLKKIAVVPQSLSLRRSWQRADLHRLLLELAAPYMSLRLNSKVLSVEPSAPSVAVESGEIIRADLVIGADGVRSVVRAIVTGNEDAPLHTEDAAYRATIPTAAMLKDPELRAFVEDAETNVWMGPGRHIVGYCIVSRDPFVGGGSCSLRDGLACKKGI